MRLTDMSFHRTWACPDLARCGSSLLHTNDPFRSSRTSFTLGHTASRIAPGPINFAGGLTDEHIAAIRDVSYARSPAPRPPPSPALSPVQAAALAYADAMTVHVQVPQDVFEALKVHMNDRKMMEVTATVASYNLVSRVLVALDVDDMAGVEVPQAGKST
jgi:hypothetical protein